MRSARVRTVPLVFACVVRTMIGSPVSINLSVRAPPDAACAATSTPSPVAHG